MHTSPRLLRRLPVGHLPTRLPEETDRVVDVTSAIETLLRFPRAAMRVVAAGGALFGCSGNHDLLAQKDVDAATVTDATIADVRSDERRLDASPSDVLEASPSDAMDTSEPPEPPEPPGRFSLTWTNGLVDVESARFCFVPRLGDREMRDQAVGPTNLAFGKSSVFSALGTIDLSTMDVHPYAVVGVVVSSAEGGQTCAAILDAPDGAAGDDGAARAPVALRLPLIPAGTLAEGRSYLGVVTGCARPWPFADAEAGSDAGDASDAGSGADGPADAAQSRDGTDGAGDAPGAGDSAGDADVADASGIDVFQPPPRAAICGASTGAPNAGLVLVRLSRRDVGPRVGFQAVHASTAVAAARVAIERTGGSTPALSVDIGPYQIVPRDGLIPVPLEDFGPTVGSAALRVASPAGTFPALTASLASALAASDIAEAGLSLGDRFSLVLIGAQPGQNPGPPWNTARIAIVRNAPFPLGN